MEPVKDRTLRGELFITCLSFGRPGCATLGMTQRGSGNAMASRTSSQITSDRPTQSFSTKPGRLVSPAWVAVAAAAATAIMVGA